MFAIFCLYVLKLGEILFPYGQLTECFKSALTSLFSFLIVLLRQIKLMFSANRWILQNFIAWLRGLRAELITRVLILISLITVHSSFYLFGIKMQLNRAITFVSLSAGRCTLEYFVLVTVPLPVWPKNLWVRHWCHNHTCININYD